MNGTDVYLRLISACKRMLSTQYTEMLHNKEKKKGSYVTGK